MDPISGMMESGNEPAWPLTVTFPRNSRLVMAMLFATSSLPTFTPVHNPSLLNWGNSRGTRRTRRWVPLLSRHTEHVRSKVTVVTDTGPSVASPSVACTVMILRRKERERGNGELEERKSARCDWRSGRERKEYEVCLLCLTLVWSQGHFLLLHSPRCFPFWCSCIWPALRQLRRMKERRHQIAWQTDHQPVCGGRRRVQEGGVQGQEDENHANTMYQVLTSYNCGSE